MTAMVFQRGRRDLVITRDAQHGLVTASSLGVINSSTIYNTFGEPTNYMAKANGNPVYQVVFTRDALGRIGQKVETIEGSTDTYTYTYALGGELTSVQRNGTEIESYGYDDNDNRTNAAVSGVSQAAAYDAQDRLIHYGNTSYTFNAAGQLVSRTTGAQVSHYQYDQLGNLLAIQLPNGTNIDYLVDGLDRRVGKKINGTLVSMLLYGDALRPVAELDASGAVISRFVYAGHNVPIYLTKAGVTYRIVTDQVNSVRLVINAATGAIVQRLDYDSFGNVLHDSNPGFQPFGFAGGLYEPLTGLVRFGRRDYEPATGRWTTKDPLGFSGGSPNLYAYIRNRPIDSQDPKGLDPDQSDESTRLYAGVVVFDEGIHEGIGIVYSDGQVDRFDKKCGDGGMFGGFGLGCLVSGSADISKQVYPNLAAAFVEGQVVYRSLDPNATQNVDAWLEGAI
jgi:RHS repeat-associated protein